MLAKTIKYKDFGGQEREGILYFNLTEAEIVRWMLEDEGLLHRLETITTRPGHEIIAVFDDMIRRSFGVRSDDGKRFVKSEEIYQDLIQTALYNQFFIDIMTNTDEAENFFRDIMPADLVSKAKEELARREKSGLKTPSSDSNPDVAKKDIGASGI